MKSGMDRLLNHFALNRARGEKVEHRREFPNVWEEQ
jgi:hypothetical protein